MYCILFCLPVTSLDRYKSSFSSRTHHCGELRTTDVGQKVQLYGWLQYNRANKFLILRDAHGLTQVMLDQKQVCTIRYGQFVMYQDELLAQIQVNFHFRSEIHSSS